MAVSQNVEKIKVIPLFSVSADLYYGSDILDGRVTFYIPGRIYYAIDAGHKYKVFKDEDTYSYLDKWLFATSSDGITIEDVINPEEESRKKIVDVINKKNSKITNYRDAVLAAYGIDLKSNEKPQVNPDKFQGKDEI